MAVISMGAAPRIHNCCSNRHTSRADRGGAVGQFGGRRSECVGLRRHPGGTGAAELIACWQQQDEQNG